MLRVIAVSTWALYPPLRIVPPRGPREVQACNRGSLQYRLADRVSFAIPGLGKNRVFCIFLLPYILPYILPTLSLDYTVKKT